MKKDKNHYSQLQIDLQEYHRKIKLADFFKNSPRGARKPFMEPSLWSPSLSEIDPAIKDLIKKDTKIFKNYYNSSLDIHKIKNLNREEINALLELKKAKHIVIKPADKGSAVVIMDREQYVVEAQRQLDDSTYYKKLDKPIYMDTIPLIQDILLKLKKKRVINKKQ